MTGSDSKMSTNTKTTKTVAKKSDSKAAAPVAAAPVAPAAPAPAPVKEKKVSKVAATPVPAAQAVEAAAAPVLPTTTMSEDVQTLVSQLNTVREAAAAGIAALKKLDKRVARELKEARKRRRVKKEGDENKPAKASVFTTPTHLSEGLSGFLGISKEATMIPADVTRAIKKYVDLHKLKGEKHAINHDTKLWAALGMNTADELSYKTLQARLYSQYIKVVKA